MIKCSYKTVVDSVGEPCHLVLASCFLIMILKTRLSNPLLVHTSHILGWHSFPHKLALACFIMVAHLGNLRFVVWETSSKVDRVFQRYVLVLSFAISLSSSVFISCWRKTYWLIMICIKVGAFPQLSPWTLVIFSHRISHESGYQSSKTVHLMRLLNELTTSKQTIN